MTAESYAAVERLKVALAGIEGVCLCFLFGSRARGRARRDSDYDLALLLDDELGAADRGRTIRRLAGRLGRAVSSSALDLVVLNGAPALLRHRVLRDGVLLFARSPEDRVRFAARAIRDYQDGEVRRREQTRWRIQRLKAGGSDGGQGDLLAQARGVARLLREAEGVSGGG